MILSPKFQQKSVAYTRVFTVLVSISFLAHMMTKLGEIVNLIKLNSQRFHGVSPPPSDDGALSLPLEA